MGRAHRLAHEETEPRRLSLNELRGDRPASRQADKPIGFPTLTGHSRGLAMTTIGWQTLGPNEPRSEKCFDSENYSIAEAMQMMRVDWPSFVLRSSPFAIWGRADEGLYHPVPSRFSQGFMTGRRRNQSLSIDQKSSITQGTRIGGMCAASLYSGLRTQAFSYTALASKMLSNNSF